MDHMQIAGLASKCAATFQERNLVDADGETGLTPHETQILETQNARFNLWADNIGVIGHVFRREMRIADCLCKACSLRAMPL